MVFELATDFISFSLRGAHRTTRTCTHNLQNLHTLNECALHVVCRYGLVNDLDRINVINCRQLKSTIDPSLRFNGLMCDRVRTYMCVWAYMRTVFN